MLLNTCPYRDTWCASKAQCVKRKTITQYRKNSHGDNRRDQVIPAPQRCEEEALRGITSRSETMKLHPSIRSRYNQPAVPFRNSYGSNKHDKMTPLPQHFRGQLLVPGSTKLKQYSNSTATKQRKRRPPSTPVQAEAPPPADASAIRTAFDPSGLSGISFGMGLPELAALSFFRCGSLKILLPFPIMISCRIA